MLLLPTLVVNTGAKEWRGIVPLHSTRSDVIRLLGSPNLDYDRYELDDGTVSILYSDGPCKTGWDVPKDTVIDIMFQPDDDLTLSDLRLDLSKYKKKQDYEVLDAYHYRNGPEGHEIVVIDNIVSSIFYGPTTKDSHLECSRKWNK